MSLLIDHADDDEELPQVANSTQAPADSTARRSLRRTVQWGLIVVMALAVAALALRGRGVGQWAKRAMGIASEALAPPLVISARPADGAANVMPDSVLTFRMQAPNGLLDPATMTPQNIALRRVGDDAIIPTAITQELGDDMVLNISVRPQRPLDGMTRYTLTVGPGLKDARGVAAVENTIRFGTGSLADPSIRFVRVPLPAASGTGFTCVQIGPDGRLWAGSDDGKIYRFPVAADGDLEKPEIFTALQDANGDKRLLTGFAFDPACGREQSAVADGRITLWVSHGWFGFDNAPDLTGKVSRISGKNLADVHDIVTGLPRSVKDHLTNQPVFGPDGALYIPQPSNTAYGAPDATWGDRPERRLNASILRLNVAAMKAGETLDVRTSDVGGTYDPAAPDAPLTVYATGIRLAYDLLWHSNGRFYAAVNGSSPGGNSPAGQHAPALTNIATTEHVWFFHIQPGRYYGHPNPVQGHYVLNGGNPTAGADVSEISEYPVGTQPDPLWTPATYDFGTHVSPNGMVECRSSAFGGKLAGKILVCRYNNGSDILCLDLDDKGQVRAAHVGIPGLTRLASPLDITEDPGTGCLYVSEYGAQSITLLRPVQ